jgi:hypothetical protein
MQASPTQTQSSSAPFKPNHHVAKVGVALVVMAVAACFLVLIVNAARGSSTSTAQPGSSQAPVTVSVAR